jgi:hypothetical protein
MDSFLDRYISYEYLVSPCPQSGRAGSETVSLEEVRNAVTRALEGLQTVRNAQADAGANSSLLAVEADLNRALALLDNAANQPWIA